MLLRCFIRQSPCPALPSAQHLAEALNFPEPDRFLRQGVHSLASVSRREERGDFSSSDMNAAVSVRRRNCLIGCFFIGDVKHVNLQGQPGGLAINVLSFGSLGFAGSDPGCRCTHWSSSHPVAASHIQNRGRRTDVSSGTIFLRQKRKIGTDVRSGIIFLKQKKRNWQQTLAQSQSSSQKKERERDKSWKSCRKQKLEDYKKSERGQQHRNWALGVAADASQRRL